jgi:outer membrane protein assembly factor BamB
VFFGCDDGRFYALDKTDGDIAWSFAPGYFITNEDVNNYITTPILSNPFVEDGVVYFGAKGNVYALDAQTFEKFEETSGGASEFDYEILLIIISLVVIALIILAIFYFYKKGKMGGKE